MASRFIAMNAIILSLTWTCVQKVILHITKSVGGFVCTFIETAKRNEDKAKLGEALAQLGEAQAKLITLEQTCHEDRIKMAVLDAKLVAMEKSYREDHEKHTLQFHEQQKENTLIQDEKRKLVEMKVDELEREVQQHSTHLYSLVPAQG